MAFGGPRLSCVPPGAHSARRQDSRKDLTPCRMALHSVSARRLRSLVFLCSSAVLNVPYAGSSPRPPGVAPRAL